jgi:hypothetical protein
MERIEVEASQKFAELFCIAGCPAVPLYKKQFYSYAVITFSYIVRKWHI